MINNNFRTNGTKKIKTKDLKKGKKLYCTEDLRFFLNPQFIHLFSVGEHSIMRLTYIVLLPGHGQEGRGSGGETRR